MQASTSKLKQLVNLVNQTYTCNSKNSIADSGCKIHYICATAPHKNKQPCTNGILIKQLDRAVMQASHTCYLNFPNLLEEVTRAHIFPAMHNKALVSLGQFFDNGYEVHLTKTHIYISITSQTYPSPLQVIGIQAQECGQSIASHNKSTTPFSDSAMTNNVH